jgi:uncharacterized membrane protein YfcA
MATMDIGLVAMLGLCAAALVAGFVDAIAGGGGLVTVPALLVAGLPPHLALGTNKGGSVFGSFAAMVRYGRGGLLDRRRAAAGFLAGLAGAFAGARLVLLVSPEVLRPVVLVLLPAAAAFVLLRPRPEGGSAPAAGERVPAVAGIALGVGAYDGFFGPGTGTFLILAFAGVLGMTATRASAEAKVVNFASNLASVAVFAVRGTVVWEIALPMAACQFAGGLLGAHLALRVGDRIVRAFVAVVVLALVAALLRDLLAA